MIDWTKIEKAPQVLPVIETKRKHLRLSWKALDDIDKTLKKQSSSIVDWNGGLFDREFLAGIVRRAKKELPHDAKFFVVQQEWSLRLNIWVLLYRHDWSEDGFVYPCAHLKAFRTRARAEATRKEMVNPEKYWINRVEVDKNGN